MLTREAILELSLKIVEVPTPEWGGSVYVREMNGEERLRFETEQAIAPIETLRERLAVATVCDTEGNLLFQPADTTALAGKSFVVLHRIFLASLDLNQLRTKDVDAAEKN